MQQYYSFWQEVIYFIFLRWFWFKYCKAEQKCWFDNQKTETIILPLSNFSASTKIELILYNLLKDLQEQLNLTILFISHDLPVIRQMCDRVAILKKGCICEINQNRQTKANLLSEPDK